MSKVATNGNQGLESEQPRMLGYVRSATEMSALVDQQDVLEAYCEDRGLEFVEVYGDVVSGLKVGPRFRVMEKRLVDDDTIDGLVVLSMDRIGRNVGRIVKFFILAHRSKKRVIVVSEEFDTSSPMGRAMLKIMIPFADLEQEQTNERIRLGMAAAKKAKQERDE